MAEKLQKTTRTQAEGEYAAEKSRREDGEIKTYTSEDYLVFANAWAEGATLTTNLPDIYSRWKDLHFNADQWRDAKQSSRSVSYNTHSRTDSGPWEFQVAEETLDNGREFCSRIEEILEGIEYSEQNASVLLGKVKEFIAVELDGEKGDSSEIEREIINTAQRMYELNFKSGFDVRQFSELFIMLSILGGGLLGGATGFGLDRLGNKYWPGVKERTKNKWNSHSYP